MGVRTIDPPIVLHDALISGQPNKKIPLNIHRRYYTQGNEHTFNNTPPHNDSLFCYSTGT